MPIYAYRCDSCGFEKDVLQKISDAPLTQCPNCGKDAFRKQVTAAGFQLKGSGWYVTDFRGNGNGAKSAPATGAKSGGEPSSSEGGGAATGGGGGSSGGDSGAASSAPAAAASPAAGTTSES